MIVMIWLLGPSMINTTSVVVAGRVFSSCKTCSKFWSIIKFKERVMYNQRLRWAWIKKLKYGTWKLQVLKLYQKWMDNNYKNSKFVMILTWRVDLKLAFKTIKFQRHVIFLCCEWASNSCTFDSHVMFAMNAARHDTLESRSLMSMLRKQ